jgi:hypothetical protein
VEVCRLYQEVRVVSCKIGGVLTCTARYLKERDLWMLLLKLINER